MPHTESEQPADRPPMPVGRSDVPSPNLRRLVELHKEAKDLVEARWHSKQAITDLVTLLLMVGDNAERARLELAQGPARKPVLRHQ